jgi:hypothetical protein
MEVSGQRHAPAILPPGKKPSHCKEAGWAPQPTWKFWRCDNSGIRTSDRPGRSLNTTSTTLFTALFSKYIASLSRTYWSVFTGILNVSHPFGFFKFNSSGNSVFLLRWHRKLRNCTPYSTFVGRLKFYHLKKETETTLETLHLEDSEIRIVLKIFTMKGSN